MELAESNYLHALAQVGITFAGFTAIFIMLRQTLTRGGETSAMDFFVTRNFLMLSFLVVSGAMLPPLLAALSLQHNLVWRVASVIVALPLLAFVVSLPSRRRALTQGRIPAFLWARESIHIAAIAILLLNAVGLLGGATGGLFELGISLVLFAEFFTFAVSLNQTRLIHDWSKPD